MESANIANYARAMTHDLGTLLGSALLELRKRTTRTQDGWTDRTGMSQSYLSAAERGDSGWESVRTIASAIERAGADPVDLLRLAVAQVDESEDRRELLALWGSLDRLSREAILTLLRNQAAARTAAR